MIVVRFLGGLGNQMFQYAFGLALSRKYNQQLYFDDTYYIVNSQPKEQFTVRKQELGLFEKLEFRIAPKILKTIIHTSNRYLLRIRRKSGRYIEIYQVENEYIYIPILKKNKIHVFIGYFQCEEYFLSIAADIRSHFTFPDLDEANKNIALEMKEKNSVSIHIRRGDYVTIDFANMYHGVQPLSYYFKAIELLKGLYNNLEFFIFSDDMDWVKENFKLTGESIHFIEGNNGSDAWKDLALMTYAKHHILANSSFSWWGAWLARNAGTKIVPANWFNPEKAKFRIQDFIPPSWTIIK